MARPREPLDLMDNLDERGGAKGAREVHHSARAVAPSLRRVVRVAQRVLRPELWGSYEVTESGDFVSVRVHRVQDGTKTVSVPISRGSSDARGKAPPSTTPTKWKDMSKKERRSIQAQRRGILNRFARTGVLADSHPARKWVRLAKAAAERCNPSVSPAQPMCGMDAYASRQNGTTGGVPTMADTEETSARGGTARDRAPDSHREDGESGQQIWREIWNTDFRAVAEMKTETPDPPARPPPPPKRSRKETGFGSGPWPGSGGGGGHP